MVYVPGFSNIPENSVWTDLLRIYVRLIFPLHMPLLFAISGYSSAIALQKKTTISFLRERLKRLILPLASFMLLLGPILYYFAPSAIKERNFDNFILKFVPYCWSTLFNDEIFGSPRWAHLWFVAYLFVFTLISLPLFLYWKNPKVRLPIIKVLSSPLGMFMPALLFAGTVTLACIWSFPVPHNVFNDLAYFSYNLIAFLLGYIIYLDKRMADVIDNHLRLWIYLWSLSTVLMVAILPGDFAAVFFNPIFSGKYFVYSLLAGLNIWSWLLATLGIARKYLSFSNRFLSYMSRASYHYFILHLVVLFVVGYFTPRPEGVIAEFVLLTFLTFVGTEVCYEFIFKRIAILRFLFGLKTKIKTH